MNLWKISINWIATPGLSYNRVMKNKLSWGLVLFLLFELWLSKLNWNLGFAVVNGIYLISSLFMLPRIKKDRFLGIIWLISLLAGATMAWRSCELVKFLTSATIIFLNVLMMAAAKVDKVELDFGKIIGLNFDMIGEFFLAGKDALAEVAGKPRKNEVKIKKIILGLVGAVPLLLIFGALFYGADPIFAKLVDQLKWLNIRINAEWCWRVVLGVIFLGSVLATWRIKLSEKNGLEPEQRTEINIAVTLLEILILVFCIIQVRYLFSTAEEFKQLGIIFSNYTRQGYGQMITASLLAYGIISVFKLSKPLEYGMMVEILILIISATKRNYVYQSVYGFTEARILGFFLSGWLLLMLMITAYKIIKKKSKDFQVKSMLILGGLTILLINLFDIDGTIVKTRPASLDWGIDYHYMVGLSDDAYMGYEQVLLESERLVRENQITSLEKLNEVESWINVLNWKYAKDSDDQKNNWNFYGNWNYAIDKSWKYLRTNQERIKNVETQLKKIETDLKDKGRAEAKKKIDEIVSDLMVKMQKLDSKVTITNKRFTNISEFTVNSIMEIQTSKIESVKPLIPTGCWIKTSSENWMIVECEQGLK